MNHHVLIFRHHVLRNLAPIARTSMYILLYRQIESQLFIIFSAIAIPDTSWWRANRIVRRRIGSDKQISCSLGMFQTNIF